jgi:hypothetical protein
MFITVMQVSFIHLGIIEKHSTNAAKLSYALNQKPLMTLLGDS